MNDLRVTGLRCEYLEDPLGIDERAPRLSWKLKSARRGARQVAWRVWVASTPQKLARGQGDRWDSGRVADDRNGQVSFAGLPLTSRQACYWQVQVWDEAGGTARSEPARWTMGLLQRGEWRARWIGANPAIWANDPEAVRGSRTEPGSALWLRTEFKAPREIKRATLYASARGLFELHLGGRKVGEDLLAPEWTDYAKRLHYRTYDVTAQVASGRNVLGAVLGDGWWSGYVGWQETRGRYGLANSLAVQLEIETASGKRLTIASGKSWRCATGPILSSDFMMGETYDARRERVGWDRPGFEAHGWLAAREVSAPRAPLVAQRSEPVRITETLVPQSVTEIRPGVYICDLGQNITGWVRLRVKGPRGTRVTVRHGERLSPDGTLYTENLRRAKATDVYILKGGGRETWEPRFTFHGFQYLEVTGLPRPPAAGDIVGCVVHSATPPAGGFACSHLGVNRLWLNGCWSQRDNFLSVPTDCPQRDERLGWTGDAQVFMRTAAYNMDVAAFFTKWMVDVQDAQTPEGIFPDTAPRLPEKNGDFVGLDGLGGGAAWADAGVIVPWTLWRVYGDRRVIERHWPAMKAWLAYLARTNPGWVRRRELGNNYGDWLCVPADTAFRTQSPMKTLLATAYWAGDAAKMAEMAAALGRTAEAAEYQRTFGKIRAAFQRTFVRKDGRLSVQTQTAYLLALAMRLLPDELRAPAAAHLVADIKAHDWHLSTGFVGISHLNPVLTEMGYADVAYRLLLREDYPSWLYPVCHGATTIWERWNGWTEKDGFFNPHMNSFNHYALGSIGEWLYRHVAGIEVAEPGFKRALLRPHPGGGLTFARAHYETAQGPIASAWARNGNQFTWTVVVPPNSTAELWVPQAPGTGVRESGKSFQRASGRLEPGYFVCEVGAGRYVFESTWREPSARRSR